VSRSWKASHFDAADGREDAFVKRPVPVSLLALGIATPLR